MRSFSYTPGVGFCEEFRLHSSSSVLGVSLTDSPRAGFSEDFLLHSSRAGFNDEFLFISSTWF